MRATGKLHSIDFVLTVFLRRLLCQVLLKREVFF